MQTKKKASPKASESVSEGVEARALIYCVIDGKKYNPNDLVTADADVIKQSELNGWVDSSADAVKYVKANAE